MKNGNSQVFRFHEQDVREREFPWKALFQNCVAVKSGTWRSGLEVVRTRS